MAWYVVSHGRKCGIFASWEDCHEQGNGFSEALYKKYKTMEEARAAFSGTAAKEEYNLGDREIKNHVGPTTKSKRCNYSSPVSYNSVVSNGIIIKLV